MKLITEIACNIKERFSNALGLLVNFHLYAGLAALIASIFLLFTWCTMLICLQNSMRILLGILIGLVGYGCFVLYAFGLYIAALATVAIFILPPDLTKKIKLPNLKFNQTSSKMESIVKTIGIIYSIFLTFYVLYTLDAIPYSMYIRKLLGMPF